MNNIISFPHLAEYHIQFKYIIEKTTKCKVIIPPKNCQQTINIGSRYSPNDICTPFKYNLGNYINALNAGANILLQGGGGCRYGYFAELQEEILKGLGYKFKFVNLIQNNHISILKMYNFAKKLNPQLNIIIFSYYLIQTILMIIYSDKLDNYLRKNMGYEKIPNSFIKNREKFQEEYLSQKLNIIKIIKIYYKYKKIYKHIILKPMPRIKILLVGELYTLMDSYANNNIERKLINKNIEIIRYTNLTYLLLNKKICQSYFLKRNKKYLKYSLGATGVETIAYSIKHAKTGIDGIIHIKSYGCVPEINAMPILNQISEDYNVPILYLSFDGENNIANIDTKLEAYYDMIVNKRKHSKS